MTRPLYDKLLSYVLSTHHPLFSFLMVPLADSAGGLPVSLLKFMVLDLQSSLDSGSGSGQSNHSAPAIPPVKPSSQISTAQSNLPSQMSSTAVVASVSASQPSTSLTNSEEALLCVRLVETLIIQARARARAKTNTRQKLALHHYPPIHPTLKFSS